ncbi:uncharacterized protein LOC142996588 isoform X5 [Genypterus blacodes]|uniref:uncharacterized protein LOC142996588 isoform X5 n=1 Tax=Genypterus blacodes TaxID=154954 RepID=UPI003F759A0C
MNQLKDTVDSIPPSKSSLLGDHDRQTKGQSADHQRTVSSLPCCVSMKSGNSMMEPLTFRDGTKSADQSSDHQRTVSSLPSCVSMKSGNSMMEPLTFRDGTKSADQSSDHQRTVSSLPSCVSMKSGNSMMEPLTFRDGTKSADQSFDHDRAVSPFPSCVSMRSVNSMMEPLTFRDGTKSADQRARDVSNQFNRPKDVTRQKRSFSVGELQTWQVPEGSSAQSTHQHQKDLDCIFMLLEENITLFVKDELKRFKKVLSQNDPECFESQSDDEKMSSEEEEKKRSIRAAFVLITVNFLRRMKQEELADFLHSRTAAPLCQRKLKSKLKQKFQSVCEGVTKAGKQTLLNEIYTELYITEGGAGGVNDEHEVRQIEAASRKPQGAETTIRCEDIFKASPGRDQPIRTLVTKGVAGIGKTLLTQKFTLDWAEGKANPHIQFTFPFTFRELNVLRGRKFSLVELLHHFFTETKEAAICSFEEFQVIFILDGLDECRPPLDFHKGEVLTDVRESTSVDVLLTNLIRGKLLPSARLWITTRPAAANQIPAESIDMMTEVRGFTDPQKEEYFRKRFKDEMKANSIISHIKTSRSLHIMCHIPVFCWINGTVLEDVMKTRERGNLPKTLTEMYIHFLIVQTKLKNIKYDGGAQTDPLWNKKSRKMIMSLGKLAFDQLQKGNLIFYESDLAECGMDITAASVYSGVFTQVFKEERGLYQNQVFCFVHLSVQEFLAALYVHLRFITSGVNLLSEDQRTSMWSKLSVKKHKLRRLHQSAVDEALKCPSGHLDLLSACMITQEGCASLASALSSNPSHLRELDLSYNHPGDAGEKLLSAGLERLRMDHGGQQRIRAGIRKYDCELELDLNTMNRALKLSDNNRKVIHARKLHLHPDHPERFDLWTQLLCRNALTGRCYWEVEWEGHVDISVSYREISRKGHSDSRFGGNNQSWSLICSDHHGDCVRHNNRDTPLSVPVSFNVPHRVGVYVDCPAGTLSFYKVSNTLIHLHTFTTTFTHTLYAGFGLCFGSSVFL